MELGLLYLTSRIFYLAFLSRISHFYLASRIFYLASRIFISHPPFLSRISHFFISHLAFLSRIFMSYLAFLSHISHFYLASYILQASVLRLTGFRTTTIFYIEQRGNGFGFYAHEYAVNIAFITLTTYQYVMSHKVSKYNGSAL